jgi:hypothetical protein
MYKFISMNLVSLCSDNYTGKRDWRMITNGELKKKLKQIFMVYLEVLILTSAWTEETLKINLRTAGQDSKQEHPE